VSHLDPADVKYWESWQQRRSKRNSGWKAFVSAVWLAVPIFVVLAGSAGARYRSGYPLATWSDVWQVFLPWHHHASLISGEGPRLVKNALVLQFLFTAIGWQLVTAYLYGVFAVRVERLLTALGQLEQVKRSDATHDVPE